MQEEERTQQEEATETQQTAAPEQEPAEAAQTSETAETAEQPAEEKQQEEPKEEAAEEKEKKSFFGGKKIEALKAKLDTAVKEKAELNDRLLRTAAEFENFRKRSAREKDASFNNGVSFAVTQILGILDTLEMALQAPCSDEAYKKGVEMTLSKASEALKNLHVEEIEALGKPFDPNLMNAVQQMPAEEGQESGSVVRVYQKGYKIGDKVIRHATVVVAE